MMKMLFRYGAFLIITLLLGCLTVKKQSLYDQEITETPPPMPSSIDMVVDPIIFDGDTSDAWGLEKDGCKEIYLAEGMAEDGGNAIYIDWNRVPEKCEWAGMGIGWENWVGKDVTPLLQGAGIRIHIKAAKNDMYGLPMVLSLQDYSGQSAFAYVGNKYFERSSIDQDWQYVTVPLSAFDLDEFGMDPTNVKQLQIELQSSGAIYVDEIVIVPYTPQPQEPWVEEPEMPDVTTLPVTIFEDRFPNGHGWGLIKDECQDFRYDDQIKYSGNTSLSLEWNNTGNCRMVGIGINWSKWYPMDLREIAKDATLQFYVKNSQTSPDLPVTVQLFDYGGGTLKTTLKSKYAEDESYWTDWARVTIPLKDFEGNGDWSRIRELNFYMEGQGKIWIDDIKMIKQ